MALNLIMLGPPGVGKGTQADRVSSQRGIPKISTGDMLREAVKNGTEIGRRAKAIMDAGGLVNDEVIIGIVKERLDKADVKPGFILDGFPRTVAQAVALDGLMDGRPPLIVLDIAAPEVELVRRLVSRRVCGQCGSNAEPGADKCAKCGGELKTRSDDNEAVVLERLKVYRRDTEPLVQFYQVRPTFRQIDGAQSTDQVARDIAAAIESAKDGNGR